MQLERNDFVALLDGLNAVAFVVDRTADSLTFSGDAVRTWLGWQPDQAYPLFDVLPDGQRDQVVDAMRAVALDGASRSLEHRLKIAGREVWARSVLKRSSAGEVIGLMQDVTDARHDERQWREVESWLVTLGETLPFDFWIWDRGNRYLLQNPISVSRLGNALGRTPTELDLPVEEKDRMRRGFARALQGETVKEEFELSGRHFSRTLSAVRDFDTIRGVLGVDVDITELKATQEALVRRKQLAALGEMAAVVAHEVRNPLGSIANVVTLLHKSASPRPDQVSLWRVIEDEIKRLDLLVANLLDFVRPGRPDLQPQALGPVVERALAQTLWTEDASDRIKTRVEGSVANVLVDSRQLELAFTNLFRNAVQAINGRGELLVTIVHERHSNADWARISIHDSGPGFPLSVQERIFEPFVTTRASGHGLGLTIVRKVVEQHKGEVWFESRAGRGTTCVMRLPLANDVVP